MLIYFIYKNWEPVEIKYTIEECAEYLGCSISTAITYITETHHELFIKGVCDTAIFKEEV